MNSVPQATELAAELSFDSLPLAPFLQQAVRAAGYTTPTPIQAGAIPLIIEGRDVVALAQTGTGKTAAFVLPLLQKLRGSKEQGVQALVLAPTRELAEQINEVVKLFSERTGLRSVTVYGGVSHRHQIIQLRNNAQIVVACPGRLMDHIRAKTIDLSKVSVLVLDEADRMLDMGFMPDIKAIIKALPAERQTMLFSATMPDEIAQLSKSVLREPTTVRVKAEQPVAAITHSMYSLDQDAKSRALATWLRTNDQALTVVFTKMKHTAKRIGERLSKDGIPAAALHGNLSQGQRQRALKGFRDGKFRALIATDIAARGIDVEGVTHVVNYDMPDTLEAYIHRTGRAGRASRQGDAISFVTRADRSMVRSIETWLKTPLARLTLEGFDGAAPAGQDEELAGSEDRPTSHRPRSGRTGGRSREGRPMQRRGDRPTRHARGERPARADSDRRDGAMGRTDDRERSGFARDRKPRRANGEERSGRQGARSDRFARSPRGERRDDRGGERREWRRDTRGSGARDEQSRGRFRSDETRTSDRFERGTRGTRDRAEGTSSYRGGAQRSDRTSRPKNGQFRRGSSRPGQFRGQRDIDQKSDYVYQEARPHFIDRTDPETRPARGPRSNQNRKPRRFSR